MLFNALEGLISFTIINGIGDVRCVVDCSNGAACAYIQDILRTLNGQFVTLFDQPDGTFPNHKPNPLEEESRAALKDKLIDTGTDLGVCFYGDADHAIFLDEQGSFVSLDLITALLRLYFIKHSRDTSEEPGTMLYHIRSSRSVGEYVEKLGGTAVPCSTGHARIKKLLRKLNGVLAGELAGHYYFRENFYCDSGYIAFLAVLSVLSQEKRPFSELISEINQYFFSGEINFSFSHMEEVLRKLPEIYPGGTVSTLDGVRIDFPDCWFIIRISNAEPVLRLVVEANAEELLENKTDEIISIIKEIARDVETL